MPELHSILDEVWQTLPSRYSGLTLDEFVIMADHIHFIIHLEGGVEKPATLSGVVGAYKSITIRIKLSTVPNRVPPTRVGRCWDGFGVAECDSPTSSHAQSNAKPVLPPLRIRQP